MFQRRQVKTHSRLMREELGESFDHLRMAAAHAATGASGALAPRVDAARKVVQPPMKKARSTASSGMDALFGATRDGSDQARKMANKGKKKMKREKGMSTGKRWTLMLGGLVMAGAAIGAASSLMKRRQSERTWDEYGSTRTTADSGSMLDAAKSTMDASVEKASAMAETAKERASDLIGSKSANTGPSGDYTKPQPKPPADKKPGETFSGTAQSKNSRP